MVKKIFFSIIAVLFATGLAIAADSVVIKGSTTVLPITQAALDAYMKANKGVQVSLSGGGSGEGIKALIDKTTNIANSSREIKKEEIALASAKGVKPVEHVVAYDALIPIVHPKNKVKGLSTDQLSLIYQGKITNWKEVGGEDLKIVVISRDSSSGTFESWDHFVMKKTKVTPRAQMLASSGAIVTAIAKNRYAISYVGMGYINKSVKALEVNGVAASAETALSKEYPFSRELYMYTNGEPTGETAGFIAFLKSDQGQKIVKKEGFVPLTAAKESKKGKK
ncbi:MAG: phosphate ABC transporter substrate-binding protein [Deltaproteobacteria bacterium HGW-Deltaproteobacteria-12]|jgi:phosphate transport system substrate-binding protein|nr:MAG: phosphate ABC transporter substrate-binding protein [Deltaproteobacteria bacterium HGW-Deltaproteobacteria-12]